MRRSVRVRAGVVALAEYGPARPLLSGVPCVVLLHGFTGSKASWTGLARSLRSAWRVIALDLPGHGDTVIHDRRFDYSLAATAELVAEALARLDAAPFALVGYSMGGRLALQLALVHPRRVARLVLESASAGLVTPAARRRRQRADEALAAGLERDGIGAFVRRWEKRPLFRSLADAPARVRAGLRRQRLACSAAGLAASLRGMGAGAQPELWSRLPTVTVPTLVVVGACDRKFRRLGRGLVARIPNASMTVIEDAGHMPHLEQPRRFHGAVRAFLAIRDKRRDEHADLMA